MARMADTADPIHTTARAHLQRDMDAGGMWTCTCEACRGLRALTGMRKVLAVRPLVREIYGLEQRLGDLSDGPEKHGVRERYLALHDQLAELMAQD
jgi:hypothetical protein